MSNALRTLGALALLALSPLASAQGADCVRISPPAAQAYVPCARPSVYAFDNSMLVTEPQSVGTAARGAVAVDVTGATSLGFAQFDAGRISTPPSCDFDAEASTVTVPRGGSVTFEYAIPNCTDEPVRGDLFFQAVRNGVIVAQGEIINNGTLPPDTTITGTYTQYVPPNTPLGIYYYILHIGLFPNISVDSATFQITVTASDLAASPTTERTATDVAPWVEASLAPAEADGIVESGGFAVVPLSPLTVPRGGSIEFGYTIVNWTSSPVTGDLFFQAIRNGVTLAQGETINNGTLEAGQTITGTFIQNVPQNAPVGEYLYFVNIGRFPNYIADSEIFQVTVTSGSELAASPLMDRAEDNIVPWTSSVWASAEASIVASPNPFAGETVLRFTLDKASEVRLAVYDLLGREMALLLNGVIEAGPHAATFDASALPSGTYVYRLVVSDEVRSGRLTLAR